MCQDGAPKRVTPKAMEFVGPAEEAALTEDAAPGEDKDASLPAPRLGPTAAPSVSESPPLLPDELAAVVDLPPWHALHLDALGGRSRGAAGAGAGRVRRYCYQNAARGGGAVTNLTSERLRS